MKSISLLGLMMFGFLQISFAQQYIPFQGKLYEDEQPFTGTKSFSFSAPDLSWSEQHNNIPVNGGLYAVILGSIVPLPEGFFTADIRKRELVVSVDGQQLDIVDLFAPIETDADAQNEIQFLSISEDTLFLSQGNYIVLPTGGDNSPTSSSLDELFVGPSETLTTKIGQLSGTSEGLVSRVYQSFRPEQSGSITAIELEFDNISDSDFSLYITEGIGDGQAINGAFTSYSASSYPSSNDGQTRLYSLELSESIPVQKFSTYSFVIEVSNGRRMLFEYSPTNQYNGGESNFGPDTDLKFTITIEYQQGGYIASNRSGTIIESLQVNSRIKDETGEVMPVGTILAYGGSVEKIPQGWLLCDGKAYDKNEFNDLFNIISTGWGSSTNPDFFRVPDLRGRFLRGVDLGLGIDREASLRIAAYSEGNTGDKVGSYQGAATALPRSAFSINSAGDHRHHLLATTESGDVNQWPTHLSDHLAIRGIFGTTEDYYLGWNKAEPNGYLSSEAGSHTHSMSGGDLETRPTNASVNYIIKY